VIVSEEVTVRVIALEVPPPGVGLKTVIINDPGWRMSSFLIIAVNCVELTKVVLWLEPLRRTLEPATKLDPLTVRVKSGPSSRIAVGLSELMTGTGLLMANGTGDEVSGPPTAG
jgi:hypothetical protein